jgi:hypothetical protein
MLSLPSSIIQYNRAPLYRVLGSDRQGSKKQILIYNHREDKRMQDSNIKRHISLKPLSRDHGIDLLCAQHGRKAVRGSSAERINLAEEIRTVSQDAIVAYLEDEHRILFPVISKARLRDEFQEHHNKVRRLMSELGQADSFVDPGIGLMARVADVLDAYVRWEENFLYPEIENDLDDVQLNKLNELTSSLESGRTRPTQILHNSVPLSIPAGLPNDIAELKEKP